MRVTVKINWTSLRAGRVFGLMNAPLLVCIYRERRERKTTSLFWSTFGSETSFHALNTTITYFSGSICYIPFRLFFIIRHVFVSVRVNAPYMHVPVFIILSMYICFGNKSGDQRVFPSSLPPFFLLPSFHLLFPGICQQALPVQSRIISLEPSSKSLSRLEWHGIGMA